MHYITKVFKYIAPDLQNKGGLTVMYHTDCWALT